MVVLWVQCRPLWRLPWWRLLAPFRDPVSLRLNRGTALAIARFVPRLSMICPLQGHYLTAGANGVVVGDVACAYGITGGGRRLWKRGFGCGGNAPEGGKSCLAAGRSHPRRGGVVPRKSSPQYQVPEGGQQLYPGKHQHRPHPNASQRPRHRLLLLCAEKCEFFGGWRLNMSESKGDKIWHEPIRWSRFVRRLDKLRYDTDYRYVSDK